MLHIKGPTPILEKPLSRFQPIINRLLAKNPDHRFGGSEELLRAIRELEARPAKTVKSDTLLTRLAPSALSKLAWPDLKTRWSSVLRRWRRP